MTLRKHANGELNKRVTVNIIENLSIDIPINENGDEDINMQKHYADIYCKLDVEIL